MLQCLLPQPLSRLTLSRWKGSVQRSIADRQCCYCSNTCCSNCCLCQGQSVNYIRRWNSSVSKETSSIATRSLPTARLQWFFALSQCGYCSCISNSTTKISVADIAPASVDSRRRPVLLKLQHQLQCLLSSTTVTVPAVFDYCPSICCNASSRYQGHGSSLFVLVQCGSCSSAAAVRTYVAEPTVATKVEAPAFSFLQLKQLSSEIYRSAAIAFAYVTSSQGLQCCSCASICSVPGSIADLQHSSVPKSIEDLMWLLPSAPASVAVLDVSLTGPS